MLRYIKIGDYKIKTNLDSIADGVNNMYIKDFEGLYETGESSTSLYHKTYSNGSILPTPRYNGKEFSIDVIITGDDKMKTYTDFCNSLLSRNVVIEVDGWKSYTSVCLRVDNEEGFNNQNKYLVIKLFFITDDYI